MNPVRVGQKLARGIFNLRGNHSEAHLSELELAAMIALGVESGQAPLLTALKVMVDAANRKKIDPLMMFVAIEKARGAIEATE